KTVETLYEKGLAHLPKSDREERLLKHYNERYHWPLAIALLLLLFEFTFPKTVTEPKAVSAQALPGRERVAVGALVLLLLVAPASSRASSSSALRDYRAGDFGRAFQEYEKLLQKKTDDPRLHFNAGAAAFRNRQFEEAQKRFSEALNSPDLNLQESAY